LFDYGLKYWANQDFVALEDKLVVNYFSSPALIDIVKKIRHDGDVTGPILLRFPHLIKKQIDSMFSNFSQSIDAFDYTGAFHAVFPLKVNQFPSFVEEISEISKDYNYGFEAGSKAELVLAMAYVKKNSPITVNGFKDEELIKLGFLAAKMGHNITLTIEGLTELDNIIEIAKNSVVVPNIGLRIRLHSSGSGIWEKSGGINSKFGLNSTELINAIDKLKESNLLEYLTMIHFHIGSQISNILPLKKAIREVGNIYAELKKMGANNLENINIGGGLAVEYAQNKKNRYVNYTIKEFANDVVYLLKEIAHHKDVKEPNIYTESGRYITASHGVLIANVIELFSDEYKLSYLKLKDKNPPLVQELYDLYNSIHVANAREYLHDSIDHMESLLTLFDLGYIDLEDRSNSEILVNLIIKKAIFLLQGRGYKELLKLENLIQEKYLLNFSIFQSMPDFWGLNQKFPIVPLNKLDTPPTRSATLWDITCDSDGEISFDKDNPLYLHEIELEKEDYFLGIFLVGAYQEVLGMKHNLFSRPTEATIKIDENGFSIENLQQSPSILEIIKDIGYNEKRLKKKLLHGLGKEFKEELDFFISENNYLKKFV
jgi:arginine decarboxylase